MSKGTEGGTMLTKTDRSLTADDRCDRCGAQAYLEALIPVGDSSMPLLFCAHHAKEHEDKIQQEAVLVTDHRNRLKEQEEESRATGDRR